MKRILIVKTSSLGDVIHNLPVISDIHLHFPQLAIDWLVEESFADIPRLHPAIQNVHTVAARRWRKNLFKTATWREIKQVKHALAAQNYDFVLDTQGLLKSAIFTTWANSVTHGQNPSSAKESIAARFYHHHYFIDKNQHAVTRNRELAALALGYSTPDSLPDYGIETSATHLSLDLPKRYIIALHGTSRDSKLWPIHNWISLGNALAEDQLSLVLPWGNNAELTRAQQIASLTKSALVLPKLGIAQVANIIEKAQAAVGVDTGLVHLATALKKNTVAIYTDTNPNLTGVLAGQNTKAINLGNIGLTPSVDEVLNALEKYLKGIESESL